MDRIHHIAIQVADIKEAVKWYQENYDIKVSYQDDSWAQLDFENVALALVLPEQHPSHFAIESHAILAYGEPKKHRDGTQSVYLKDPFGNTVEMLQTC